MFARDTGAPAGDKTNPYEGTELKDMPAAGANPQKAMNGVQSEQKEQQNQKPPVQQPAPQKVQQPAAQQPTAPQQPLSPQQQVAKNMSAVLDPLAGVEVKPYKPAKTPPKTLPKNDK